MSSATNTETPKAYNASELIPYTTFRYIVKIGDAEMGFSEVSSMDMTMDVIEYREGWMNPTPKKYPGLTKYGNITLKKGLTKDTSLYNWITGQSTHGGYDKRTVVITLVGEKPDVKLYTWTISNAWVSKYTTPDFKASSGELAFESIELVHEGFVQAAVGGADAKAPDVPNSGGPTAAGGGA